MQTPTGGGQTHFPGLESQERPPATSQLVSGLCQENWWASNLAHGGLEPGPGLEPSPASSNLTVSGVRGPQPLPTPISQRDTCEYWNILPCVCVPSRFSRIQLFATMDHSPPSYSVHGVLQAMTLEWVGRPSSRDFQPRDQTCASCISGIARGFHRWRYCCCC